MGEETDATLRERLVTAGGHLTRQRCAVYSYLRRARQHPTAEEVYAWFKSLKPQEQADILEDMPKEERDALLKIVEELSTRDDRKEVGDDFLAFVKHAWPEFIAGRHHAQMAEAFESVASGKCKRLIINMPPRHTKSEFASYLLPAWFLGKYPNKKIIQTSHTAELAVGFGRKVRNLVDSDKYKRLFPAVELQSDSKAAGRWNTNFGGDYFAKIGRAHV